MGLTMRPSNPALQAVSRALRGNRDRLVEQWAQWVTGRVQEVPHVRTPTVERHLTLLVDILIESAGPLRRQVAELWFTASEVYGQTAANRGLAAGEVVEELQQLREILIHFLSEPIATLPARQSMAAVLRLNRILDRGISHAVVGYTDALVETLLNRRGVPIVASEPEEDEVLQRLESLEEELEQLRLKSR
jgi:hypothetical protein